MKDTFNALVIMNTGLPTGGADKTMDDGLTADFLPFLVWRLSISLAGNRLPVKFLFRSVLKRIFLRQNLRPTIRLNLRPKVSGQEILISSCYQTSGKSQRFGLITGYLAK